MRPKGMTSPFSSGYAGGRWHYVKQNVIRQWQASTSSMERRREMNDVYEPFGVLAPMICT